MCIRDRLFPIAVSGMQHKVVWSPSPISSANANLIKSSISLSIFYSILIDCIIAVFPSARYVMFTRYSPEDVGSFPTRKPLSFLSAWCTTENPEGLFELKNEDNIETASLPLHFLEELGKATSTTLSIAPDREEAFPEMCIRDRRWPGQYIFIGRVSSTAFCGQLLFRSNESGIYL